jgi:hypothetical protein
MKKSFAAIAALAVVFSLACGSSTTPEIPKYARVVLVSFVWVAPSGQTYGHPGVTGVVKNEGLGVAGSAAVSCRVLGSGMAVVTTGEAILGKIDPGQTVPFSIVFYQLTDWYGCYPTQATDFSIRWND